MVMVFLKRDFYDSTGFLHKASKDGNEVPATETLPKDAVPCDPVAAKLLAQARAEKNPDITTVQDVTAAVVSNAEPEPEQHPASKGKQK